MYENRQGYGVGRDLPRPRAEYYLRECFDLGGPEGVVHGGGGKNGGTEAAKARDALEDQDEDVLREALHGRRHM